MGAQRSVTRTSSKRKSTTLQHLFDLDSNKNFNTNTTLKQSSFESENEEILSLISYCTFVFTFTDPSESPSKQDMKRLKLSQLVSIVKTLKTPLDDIVLSSLFTMISMNLFRPLPPSSNTSLIAEFPDDEDPMISPVASWPHLQLVYDILLRLILNLDPKTLRLYINHPFLISLLALFQSEDPRERDSLKNVYHRIYSKFTFYRSFMRKSMNDVFLHYVFETDRNCGIGEMLEIWGSIINGFTVPLKEEHKMFLTRVLVPLHKPKGMQGYHRQLAYCVTQFVQKEPALGEVVVKGILRYWPITNCQKEVLLIGEIEELVESIDPEQYSKLAGPLCTRIAKCLSSLNSQVAERTLYVWNNEYFVKMAMQALDDVFPAVVERIEKNLKWHWSKSVRQLTSSVKVMLEEMEPTLYSKYAEEFNIRESLASQLENKRKQKWERLEIDAAAVKGFLQQPQSIHVCN